LLNIFTATLYIWRRLLHPQPEICTLRVMSGLLWVRFEFHVKLNGYKERLTTDVNTHVGIGSPLQKHPTTPSGCFCETLAPVNGCRTKQLQCLLPPTGNRSTQRKCRWEVGGGGSPYISAEAVTLNPSDENYRRIRETLPERFHVMLTKGTCKRGYLHIST
jgi:hypothetical protein